MAEASMRDGGNGYIIIKFIYLKILEIRGKPEKSHQTTIQSFGPLLTIF